MGASQVSCQVAAAVSGTGDRETTTVGRLFKSGFEIAVHGDKTAVAESGAWCNDLEGRCHKGELR
jgi:hypothetical protein